MVTQHTYVQHMYETKQHSNKVQGIQNYASKYVQNLSRKYTVST